jgi:hypothetical protein
MDPHSNHEAAAVCRLDRVCGGFRNARTGAQSRLDLSHFDADPTNLDLIVNTPDLLDRLEPALGSFANFGSARAFQWRRPSTRRVCGWR